MKKTYYDAVVKFVDDSFGRKHPHFERTVYWLQKFMPEATEAHLIAAYGHDIEHAFRPKEVPEEYLNETFLRNHQEGGARILSEFLVSIGAPQEMIETVAHLVGRHEYGGDEEQNALRDADSVSYIETKGEHMVTETVKKKGYDAVREKLDWMFNRIGSEKRKEYARENFEKWSILLETAK
jgi:hypothetical protein